MTDIRLSPSGPVIANAEGGPLNPGPGCQLRLAEATTIVGTHSPIEDTPVDVGGTPGGTPQDTLIVSLDNPNAAYKYRAEVHCDVENAIGGTFSAVQMSIFTSFDDGATWSPRSTTNQTVEEDGYRPCKSIMVLQSLDIPEGTARLSIKGTVAASPGRIYLNSKPPGTGTAHLQLTELF